MGATYDQIEQRIVEKTTTLASVGHISKNPTFRAPTSPRLLESSQLIQKTIPNFNYPFDGNYNFSPSSTTMGGTQFFLPDPFGSKD